MQCLSNFGSSNSFETLDICLPVLSSTLVDVFRHDMEANALSILEERPWKYMLYALPYVIHDVDAFQRYFKELYSIISIATGICSSARMRC